MLGIFFTNSLVSQDYTGEVVNKRNEPIPFVNIIMYSTADSTFLEATTTDNNGKFKLRENHKDKNCFLEISHLSYLTRQIPLKNQPFMKIVMQENLQSVGEVVVVGKKRLMAFKQGNLVANISVIHNHETSSVAKVLKQLPGVTANGREGLTLNGTYATLYIDGRKQQLQGTSVVKMLEGIPAASVEQVELKSIGDGTQDAADSEAIINLVTKKQKINGCFFSVGLESILYDRAKKAGGGNLFYMFKNNNILFNISLSYQNDYSRIVNNDSTHYRGGLVMVNDKEIDCRLNKYVGSANLAWELNKGHTLNFNIFGYDDFSNESVTQFIRVQNSDNDRNYIQTTKSKGNDDLWSGNIEYSSPDSLSSKVVASYAIDYGGIRSEKDYITQQHQEDDKELYLSSEHEMIGYRHTMKVDFIHSFKDINLKIDLGVKTDFSHLDEDVLNRYKNKVDFSDSYFYADETVYAGYLKASYKINSKLRILSSLRIERTNYSIDLRSSDEKTNNSYTNYFPYVHLYYRPSENYQSVIAYVNSMKRQNYEHMLPGIRYNNEFSYRKGNPDIKPTLVRGVAWIHYLYGYGNISFRYRHIKDLEGEVLTGKNGNITEYTYLNYADNRQLKIDAYLPFEFFDKKLGGYISGGAKYNSLINLKNEYEIPEGRKGDYWNGSVKGGLNYKITPKFEVNTWAQYNPKYRTPQFDYQSNWSMDLGMTYSMLKDERITCALMAENLFDTYKRNYKYYYSGNKLSRYSHNYGRFIKFSVFIKFHKGENIRDKARENVNDTSRFL